MKPAGQPRRKRHSCAWADRARVFHVYRRRDLSPEPLCFPSHIGLLEQALQLVRPLLVVIEPIMAFLDASVAAGDDALAAWIPQFV